MKDKSIQALAVTAGCFLLLFQSAVADVPVPEDIDQIIVSAARTPLSVRQIGSASTIITRTEIEQRQARYVSDLLRSVPGFSVSHTGVTGSQTQIRVRGAEANHILVLIDGVRANDPATGDEFRWEYLGTGDIERIEVIRGPQSSLWGSDAVAAVVHIITQSGQNASGYNAYAEGGSFGTANVGLNASLVGDQWTLRAGAEHLDTDGSNISRLGSEKDRSDLSTATLAAAYSASDSLSIRFGLRAVDAYSQFDAVDFFITGLPTDGDVASDTRNFFARAGATLQRQGSRISQQFNVHYFESDNQNLSEGTEDSSSGSDRLSFAYQIDLPVDENVLSLALHHEQTKFRQSGAVVFGDPNQIQKMEVSSAAVEFQGRSLERLTWIVSMRADSNSDFDDALNARVSLAYELSDTTTLRGTVGSGRKNPTFIERFGFFPGQFIGNPLLKPERSTSYDIGLDHSLAGDAVQVQLSLFQQDLTDEINGFVFDNVTFTSTAENRAGKSTRSGVELAARWTLSDSLTIGSNYTYTDAAQQDSPGIEVRELRRPRHAGGLSVNVQTLEQTFAASLNADYGGSRTDIFFAPWPNAPETVTLRQHWLVSVAVQYRLTTAVTAFARGSNLLDEDYEQVFGYRTTGRAGFIGVRASFGG